MQEEMEMKSGSAVRSVPAGSGNGAYESVTLRQKQQLERYLNFFSSVAFSTCLLATWESAGGSLLSGLYNGGPAAIVYGIILSTVGNLAIACSLAELASLHPTAGAQYHWSYFLAPRGRRFISFFQGWVTVFSWSALVCIAPYFIGTQIQGMVVLAHPDYELVRWRGTLLMWAVAIIPIIINIFARRVLGGIEVAAGIMHVVFLPVTIAVFVILAPRNPDSFVWNTFVGGLSGWKDSGVVFSIGLLGVITPLAYNGLPFSDFFALVDPTYKIPLRALFLVASCIFALSFIQIGSTAAFNAILSLSTLGLYISYLIPLILLVLKRFTSPQDIPQGTFSLGKFGLPMNLLAILFATYFVIFLPFPATVPVTAENMNYAGPVLGFVILFACGDWIVRGRHKWEGPKMRSYARNE
ncbi:amino acid/polyamine transporter I [Penicillium canescens]|nr:amino acid/polyamine transporter I [Penicillium canescens]